MQKIFVLAVILVTGINGSVTACNCGGSSFAGGGGLGLMSHYQKNFAGLTWEHKKTESRSSIDGEYNSLYQFNTVEAMAKYFPVKRLYFFAVLPYQFNMNDDAGVTQKLNGFGDITLSTGYQLLKSNDSICKRWKHSLTLGAGVKMPTGKFKTEDEDGALISPYLQPGTGSWDALMNVAYSFDFKDFGLFSEANYKLNTENKEGFKFGNRFTAALSAFYRGSIKQFRVLPSAGMMFENIAMDKEQGAEDLRSGGDILFATLGLDIFFKKVGLGFNYQQPTYQDIGYGFAKSKSRWQTNLSIAF